MKFSFKAKNQAGEVKEGTINASNREMAIQMIQKGGLKPFVLDEMQKSGFSLERFFAKLYASVSEKELVVFFRQLAILIEARVPISSSLASIQEQTANPYFKSSLSQIIADVEDGDPLSNAMEKFKDIFPLLSVNIIRSGENSGTLKKAIDYVAENIEKNYTLTSRVRGALIYPGVIMSVFWVVGFVVSAFIIPNLSKMIKELGTVVPWYTQLVMNMGDFMQSYWWVILVGVIGIIGGCIYYIRTDSGRHEMDKIKLELPVIGTIFRDLYISRFGENLAVLLAGGIPIVQAIRTTSDVIGNSFYRELLLQASDEVKNGGDMSAVFRQSTLMPPMVSQMVKIGEDSGQLDSVLNHIAKFYEQETEMMTKNLSTLIEPVLMIVIGIAVGFLAFAVLMPIYDIAGQIK